MQKCEEFVVRWAAILAGVFLLVLPFLGARLFNPADGPVGAIVSLVLGALVLEAGFMTWYRAHAEAVRKTVTVHTEEGESSIAIDALEGILRDELCKSGDVHDVSVRLEAGGEEEPIHCTLRFRLDSQPDIPSRTDAHKRTVREAFAQLIPDKSDLAIDCHVDSILVAPKAESGRGNEEAFSGPVYPVPPENDKDAEGSA